MQMGSPVSFYDPSVSLQLGTAYPRSFKSVVALRSGYSTASPTYGQVRDYVGQTIPTLQAGRYYYAECWARIPTTYSAPQATSWIKSGFGMSFTSGSPTLCPKWDPSNCEFEYELPASPASVLNTTTITDQQWHQISGTFKASGTENFVTIGLFAKGVYTKNQSTGVSGPAATTYIDDVRLTEVPTALAQSCPSPTSVVLQTVAIANCSSPNFQYTWTGPNGYYSQEQLNPTVSPFQSGIYTLTVLLPNGTSHVSTTSVPTAPCMVTPMRTAADKTIEAYPNPASEYVNIVVVGSDKGQAILYDGQGVAVQKLTLRQGKVQLTTQHLRIGMYHLRVVTEDGSVLEKQISITN
jgi:hypothetical protein